MSQRDHQLRRASCSAPSGPASTIRRPDNDKIYYFAGDVNFGRAMKKVLLRRGCRPTASPTTILALTESRPLIVNLEGVVLPNVPEAIDDMTLAMPQDLAVGMAEDGSTSPRVGLANNHAFDLGASGYAETTGRARRGRHPWFGQGERWRCPASTIVGLTDIDTNGSQQTDLLTPALLDRLDRPDAERPVVAFVHWGREYMTEPSQREKMLADEMRLRSVSAIVGAHPHVASDGVLRSAAAMWREVYSLGNFLFDQSAERVVGRAGGDAGVRAGHGLHAQHPAAELLRHGTQIERTPAVSPACAQRSTATKPTG